MLGVFDGGAIPADLAATGAALAVESTMTLGGLAVGSFLFGVTVGTALAERMHGLPSILGRTRARQRGVVSSALPFVAVITASRLGPLETSVGLAALGSGFAVGISEFVLDRGPRDDRFDGDDLEDPDELLKAIDRQLAAIERRSR